MIPHVNIKHHIICLTMSNELTNSADRQHADNTHKIKIHAQPVITHKYRNTFTSPAVLDRIQGH